MSECFIQQPISKIKFLNYNFNNSRVIKCLVKKDFIFNILHQAGVYNLTANTNIDILKVLYAYLINTGIDTNKMIMNRTPINFLENSCFIPSPDTNDVMIIREIFNVCVRNQLKLHICIETEQGILHYRD